MPAMFTDTRQNWSRSHPTSSWLRPAPQPWHRCCRRREPFRCGNATGFTIYEFSMSGKWLELLKEIAPGVTRAAVLRDPAIASGIGQFGAVQIVAPALGV